MTWEGREILCFLYPEDEDPGEDDAENVDEGQGQADQKQNPNIVIQSVWRIRIRIRAKIEWTHTVRPHNF